MTVSSYWDVPEGPPEWIVPPFPPAGHSSLTESTAKSRSEIVYVQDDDLAAKRSTMNIPVAESSPQDAFVRATILLTCRDPESSDTVVPSAVEDGGVWSKISGIGGQLAGYVPGLLPLSQKAADIYRWIQSVSATHSLFASSNGEKSWSRSEYRKKSAIRALSWHHKHTTLAFADGLDSVIVCSCDKVYPSSSGIFSTILKHEAQKEVGSLSWDTFSDYRLGVCCAEAIVVWDLNPRTVNGMDRPLLVLALRQSSFTSLLFTSNLALIAATRDANLREYDLFSLDTEEFLPYSGVLEVTISPHNSHIAYCDSNGFIGVLKEDGLDNVFHLHAGSVVSALAWLPDSTGLIFAKENSAELSTISIAPPPSLPGRPPTFHSITTLGRFIGSDDDDFIGRDGRLVDITSLSLDEGGRRLAVIFQNRKSKATRCLLSSVKLDGKGKVALCRMNGWIALPKEDVPIFTSFFPSESTLGREGGILSVASRGGEISHIPFFHDTSCQEEVLPPPRSSSRPSRSLFLHILSCLTGPVYHWLLRLMTGMESAQLDLYRSGLSSDVADVSALRWQGETPSLTRLSSFVERKVSRQEEYRKGDILSRSLSSTPEPEPRTPSSERYSDHHMSVDRSPDPSWKAHNNMSPLAQQLAALAFGASSGEGSFPLAKSTKNDERFSDGMGLPSRLKFAE